jgi:hypothetical protein
MQQFSFYRNRLAQGNILVCTAIGLFPADYIDHLAADQSPAHP